MDRPLERRGYIHRRSMGYHHGQVSNEYGSVCLSFFSSQAMVRLDLFPEIPLADSGSLTTGSSVDGQAGFEIGRLPKPTWRICAH